MQITYDVVKQQIPTIGLNGSSDQSYGLRRLMFSCSSYLELDPIYYLMQKYWIKAWIITMVSSYSVIFINFSLNVYKAWQKVAEFVCASSEYTYLVQLARFANLPLKQVRSPACNILIKLPIFTH